MHAEHGHRHPRGFPVALANRHAVEVPPRFLERLAGLAGLAAEREQRASARARFQRQHVALAHVMAHDVLRIDAMQAHAHRVLAHVERHALPARFHQLAHERQHDVAQIEAALIERAEREGRGPELIAAVVETQQQPMLNERAREAQQRALVEARAVREFGERERAVLGTEREQDGARAIDDGDALFLFDGMIRGHDDECAEGNAADFTRSRMRFEPGRASRGLC